MHRTLSLAALVAASLTLAACGAAASPSPSASAASSPSAATDAPTGSADATTSPAGSDDAGSSPSFELPSFSLPSGAEELEAVLPDEMCGADVVKFSLSGQDFEEQADAELQAVLDEIGAEASDVSMAVAGNASTEGEGCGTGIIRIAGAGTEQIRDAFISATEAQGDTVDEQQLGGRTLYTVDSDGESQHFYFTGDAMVFVSAPEAELEGLLDQLP